MEVVQQLKKIVDAVRAEFAPDDRVALFDVGVRRSGARVTLVGATSEPAAYEALQRRVGTLDSRAMIANRVLRLPEERGDAAHHALATAAVAPMLAGPRIDEPQISQALLGQRLLVLRARERWMHCRTEDGYLGWVHRGYLRRVDEAAARAWEVGTEGEACLSLGAVLRSADGEVLARLPWGAQVVRHASGEVRLPDGRTGSPEGVLITEAELPTRFPPVGQAVVDTAAAWMGAPYLWGGLTPAGVDCSGLVQAVFRTHGIELPRDSDQQAGEGNLLDPGPDFQDLRAGDLLFFAEEPGRITHVVISAGGARIVHSSVGNGGVRRNDLTGPLAYERELRDLFVCARRILG